MTYLFNMKFESVKFLSRSFEAYFSDYGNDFNVSSFFAVCSKQIGECSLTKLNVGSPLVLGVLGVQALPVHLSRPNNRQAKINYFLRKKYYRVNHLSCNAELYICHGPAYSDTCRFSATYIDF